MKRALIREEDGLVLNVIEIEKDSDWTPPEGHILLSKADSKRANPGDTWDGEQIIPQPKPDPAEEPRDLASEIDAIDFRLKKLEK